MTRVDSRGEWLRRVLIGLTGSALLVAALGSAPAAHAATGSGAARRSSAAAPLTALFDNVGISDDADPTAADIDGTGHSFSAEDLAADGWTPGAEITLDGTPLCWPNVAAGTPDNVVADGQTVAVLSQLGFGTGQVIAFTWTLGIAGLAIATYGWKQVEV